MNEVDSTSHKSTRIFYGWWIVAVVFLNLFFTVGFIFYGFPVFYPSFVVALGFTRAQVTQGFLVGFLLVGLPFGFWAGSLIDRVGARWVILPGIAFIGLPLIAAGSITHLWQYEVLCVAEVIGYTLAGPIANQVLITQWFRLRRGRAMGYAYLGLGLSGVVFPLAASSLIRAYGWRHALEIIGTLILVVLFPIGLLVTRSSPFEMGLAPDGLPSVPSDIQPSESPGLHTSLAALRTRNFWLLLAGCALVIGAINSVIQHFILFMKDQGYSGAIASRYLSILLAASLASRILVGYLADSFPKKNTMAFFYLLLGVSIPLLYFAHAPAALLGFVAIFGVAMGADYMLIPLVTAQCFGVSALGKLLAVIIMGYSIGQWVAPWLTGRIFDHYHSYTPAWMLLAFGSVLGSAAIYGICIPGTAEPPDRKPSPSHDSSRQLEQVTSRCD
jgi:MFS family permease